MKKLFDFITSHRTAVLIITALLLVGCVASLANTRINSDMSTYLDDSSVTKQAMQVLSKDFGINGDATVCVQGELADYEDIAGLIERLGAVKNVSSIAWLGSYSQLFTLTDDGLVSADPMLETEKVQALTGDWFKLSGGKGYYLMSVSLAVGNASREASLAMDEYKTLLTNYASATGADYYLGGSVMQGKNMIDSALGDLPVFLIAAVLVIALILLLTSKSYVSACIFLLTIGISILLNMGTNFFTSSVSIATFSVAAILQLALSMDYSIFLTHSYETEEKKGNPDALWTAVKRTSVVILASALTTVAGFCALFFMRYHMGADLGLCLAKGVTLSLLTVLIVQPCLMLTLKKACKKTEHKVLQPRFGRYARFTVRHRYTALIIALLLIVPSVFFSATLKYYYLDTDYSEQSTGAKAVVDDAGSQMVFVVPAGDDDAQMKLLTELKKLREQGDISSISGFYAMADTLFGEQSIALKNADGTEIGTLTLDVADILAIVEGGGELSEAAQARLEAKVTSLVTEAATREVTRRAVRFTMNNGRQPNEAEIDSMAQSVGAQLQSSVERQLKQAMAGFEGSLAGYGELLAGAKAGFVAEVDGVPSTYFAVSVTGAAEGDEAVRTVERIEKTIYEVFGKNTRYLAAGSTQSVIDLAALTQRDFLVVSLVSVALILLILIVTFKTLLLPLLMVAVIELAVFVNMALTSVTGSDINFMTYIIISAIQLGATIDYAILLVKSYRAALAGGECVGSAVITAIQGSAFSILISVAILAGACLSVYFISGDALIREITLMVGRGSIISAFMVLFILPGLLALRKDRWKM